MPSIELNFIQKKFDKFCFYYYTINVKDYPKYSFINGQNIVLNNKDVRFEDKLSKNYKKITFNVNNNKIELSKSNQSNEYNIELHIGLDKNEIYAYLKFIKKGNKNLVYEYVVILNHKSIEKELKELLQKQIQIQEREKQEREKQEREKQEREKQEREKQEREKQEREKQEREKNIIQKEILKSTENKKKNYESLKKKLLESKIGLQNQGSTCYMASILQLLIHTKEFLTIFFQNYNENNKFSKILFDLFQKIFQNNKEKSISFQEFSNSLNQIDPRYSSNKGNNPILFFTHFIEHLNKENNNLINPLFKGIKQIVCRTFPEINEIEEFLIYTIQINPQSQVNNFSDLLVSKSCYQHNNKNHLIEEKIIESSSILIINIDNVDERGFTIEYKIKVCNHEYQLYAINLYTDAHSILYTKINDIWFLFNDHNVGGIDNDRILKKGKKNYIFNLFYKKK